MRIKLLSLLCIINLFFAGASYAQTKIGKINLSLLASLHPKMAVFEFYRMGFFISKLDSDFNLELAQYENTEKINKNRIEAEKKVEEIKKQIEEIDDKLAKIKAIEKVGYVESMSQEGQKAFNELYSIRDNLKIELEKNEYRVNNPDLTTYDETRQILSSIEKDIIDAVKEVAQKGNYDVVLNTSIPVPYGYPAKYKKEILYSKGPVGMQQTAYYAVLSDKPEDKAMQADLEAPLNDWLSITSRADAQDMLPVKPWPLVMQGGYDLLPEALRIIYSKNNIDKETYDLVLRVLQKTGSVRE